MMLEPRQTNFLTERHQSRLENAVDELNRLLKIVKKEHPEANYYLDASGNLYIMSGETHETTYDSRGEQRTVPRQDRVLGYARINSSSGGDW